MAHCRAAGVRARNFADRSRGSAIDVRLLQAGDCMRGGWQSLGWVMVLAAGSVAGQTAAREDYDVAYIGPPMEDPVLQHSKETYVLFGCAYCHGIYLAPRGEAADLM